MQQDLPADLFAGKYRLVRLLGRGAMGEVWLADEAGPRGFSRQVALKRLLATEGISDYARESFVAEAQVIARLDHPNIVRLIELGESDDRGLYLALEYIDGAALDRVIRKSGALSPAAVALVGREVARALDAVHTMRGEQGEVLDVVHRDVSPANILLGRDGRVRLSDFGVARIHGLGGAKTETGVFKGKLPYMPPEQALGRAFDGRADVFSLGITLVEALLGGRLRKAETQGQLIAMVATEPAPKVHEVVPDAPVELAQALDAATEFRYESRLPSAAALASLLQGFLHRLGPEAESAAWTELCGRVAAASGSAPARAPWSLAVSGEVPVASHERSDRFASTGSNPITGSTGYGTGPHGYGTGPHAPSGHPSEPPGVHVPSSPTSPSARSVPATTRAVDEASPLSNIPTVVARRSSRVPILGLGLALLLGTLGGVAFVLVRGGSEVVPGSSLPPSASAPRPDEAVATAALAPTAVELATSSTTASNSAIAPPLGPRIGLTGTARRPAPSAAPSSAPTTEASSTEPGSLQVVVVPWGNVSVDGSSRGMTPLPPISLPPGTHSITVSNPELGASRSASVRIESGKRATLKIDLKRAE